jgi:hypothetical protein
MTQAALTGEHLPDSRSIWQEACGGVSIRRPSKRSQALVGLPTVSHE